MRIAWILALLPFLAAAHASAWSDAGHRIVASLAFNQLTDAERAAWSALLAQHPRYQADFARELPKEAETEAAQHEWRLQQAAVWPDIARGFRGADEDAYHRATWHYITRPHFFSAADRTVLEPKLKVNLTLDPPALPELTMNVVQAIRYARRTLSQRDKPAAERAVMLCWLVHLTGDLHQPMHSTSLHSQVLFPEGDRGGNLVLTQQRGNLHSVWDQFLGYEATYRTARNRALKLSLDPELAALGAAARRELDESRWLTESHDLAVSLVYDAEVLGRLRALESDGETETGSFPPLKLSDEYLRTGGRAAERRVVQAGFRLAAILQGVAP